MHRVYTLMDNKEKHINNISVVKSVGNLYLLTIKRTFLLNIAMNAEKKLGRKNALNIIVIITINTLRTKLNLFK